MNSRAKSIASRPAIPPEAPTDTAIAG